MHAAVHEHLYKHTRTNLYVTESCRESDGDATADDDVDDATAPTGAMDGLAIVCELTEATARL